MIVHMTICKDPDCKKGAIYNLTGLKAWWCKLHKTPEMVDVKHKRCPCGNHPNFNLPGETVGVCCKECKTDDMVNVVSKRCPCGNHPIYNLPGDRGIVTAIPWNRCVLDSREPHHETQKSLGRRRQAGPF
jgi:hypothetical protein